MHHARIFTTDCFGADYLKIVNGDFVIVIVAPIIFCIFLGVNLLLFCVRKRRVRNAGGVAVI